MGKPWDEDDGSGEGKMRKVEREGKGENASFRCSEWEETEAERHPNPG